MAISTPLYSLVFHNNVQLTPESFTIIQDAFNNIFKSGKLVDAFTMRLIFEYKQTNDIILLIRTVIEKYINDTITFVTNNTKNKKMSVTIFIELLKRTFVKTSTFIKTVGDLDFEVNFIFNDIIRNKINSSFFDMFDFITCIDNDFVEIIDLLNNSMYTSFGKLLFQNYTFIDMTVTKYISFAVSKQIEVLNKMTFLLKESLLFFEIYKYKKVCSTEESLNTLFIELKQINEMKTHYYQIQFDIKRILILKIRLIQKHNRTQ